MFRALIVDDDIAHSVEIREALADAGCVDIEALSLDDALVRIERNERSERLPDLAVINLTAADLARLHRLARGQRALPIVAVCEEKYIDAVYLAGAAEVVTTPIRKRELLGRIRSALRDRRAAQDRMQRERKMTDTIVALQQEKEDLERLACVDALTGIANRRHALGLLAAEWRRSSREHQPIGLVMLDLDCYHQFNEQYGHQGGDECLQRVCDAMAKCLRRPSDFLGRYGGEEFIAVLPNTDAVGAKIVAERLRASVEALGIPHSASVCAHVVTITAGFAALHVTPDLSVDKLIAVADQALLRAKAQGRNRIEGDAPLVRPSRVSAQRWQRFQPVFADPWFADRIPAYLAEAHAGARTILHALRSDDAARVEQTTRSLEVTARSLGLTVLQRLVAELARAIEASDVAAAREATDEVIQYVTHVQVIYRRGSEPQPEQLLATAQ